MTQFDWTKHSCGRTPSAITWLLAITLIGLATGCGDGKKPSFAEEDYPEYTSVKAAFRDLAFQVGETLSTAQAPIRSFAELQRQIERRFPGTKVLSEGTNPFPTVLPQHDYGWLRSWTNNAGPKTPLIWTTVRLREPAVLQITTGAEIVVSSPGDFERMIRECLSNGCLVGSAGRAGPPK